MPFEFTDHPAWHRVSRWPGLSAEAKLTWLFLWGLADLKPDTIRVHEADIGANQGAVDPKRIGQRILSVLTKHGLIVVLERDGLETRLRVLDPAAVAEQPSGGGGKPAA